MMPSREHHESAIDIRIVLGFSSAGKSTYIKKMMTEMPKFAGFSAVFEFMFRSGEREKLVSGDIFHMDISAISKSDLENGDLSVIRHPLTELVFKNCTGIKVVVLVASSGTIRERIKERRQIGIDFGRDDKTGAYPAEQKLRTLDACPLEGRYAAWFHFLTNKGIPFSIVRTDQENYPIVPDIDTALEIIRA